MDDIDEAPAGPRVEAGVLALIGLGGAVGALLRHGVDVWLPSGGDGFPWATFGINVVGALGLGLLHAYLRGHRRVPRGLRALLGAGLLGGFTTFSAYAEQTRSLLSAGHEATALLYVLGTLAAAVVAVEATGPLVRRLMVRRRR